MSALYVHIPFCEHICAYCDFCKVFYDEQWADLYLDALAYEIEDKKLNENYDTIYIGGGTPSALSYVQLERLLQLLQPYACQVKEYSIEVNPESMDEEKLDLFKKYHVGRLSIGVQSFQDHLLKEIGRYHSSLQVFELIQKAYQKGFDDINIDLIYGLPHQTFHDLKNDLEIIKSLPISHISIYALILEDHTVLKNDHYQPLDDEQDAMWYHYISQTLENYGFTHYEVSNYYLTKPSYHNLTYWKYHDYEGVGLGAHSLKQHHRYENTRSLTQYLQHHYLKDDVVLSQEDELFEKIMMGLRLYQGIDLKEVNDLYCVDLLTLCQDVIRKYEKLEMLEIKNGFLRVTKKGMDYLNTILVDMLSVMES